MTEVNSGDGANHIPLFISTSVRLHYHGKNDSAESYIVTDSLSSLAPTIDRSTGKCVRILDNLITSAIKSGAIEDILVLGEGGKAGQTIQTHLESFKNRKKRLFVKARLRYVELPSSGNCRSETDELKHVIEQDVGGALISNGFIWTHALVIPPKNWTKFIATSRATLKKDSLGVSVFYPELCLSLDDGNALGSRHQIIVLNQKNGELLKRTHINVYQRKQINVKEDLALKGKFTSPPEDIEIRTDVQSFPLFYGNGMSFLKFIQSNFDYASLEAMMDDSLNAENSLESFYVYRDTEGQQEPDWTARPGTNLQSPRVLYNYLKEDACRYTDKMAMEGERSYWKYDVDRKNVYHESYDMKDVDINRCLVFDNVKLAKGVSINDCVLCQGSSINESVEGLIIGPENGTGNGSKSGSFGYILPYNKGFIQCNDEKEFKYDVLPCCSEISRHDELSKYKENSQERQFRKTDDILDQLYSEHSSISEDSADDEGCAGDSAEFSSEVQSMISSVINNPDHMTNIIMELRTYRLAEFKSDHDVLRAAIPVLLADITKNENATTSKLQERMAQSKMGDLFQSFCGNPDDLSLAQKGHAILYEEIAKFAANRKGLFPKLCAAFNNYSDHQTHLPEWIESNKTKYPQLLTDSPILQQYLDWLAEDDDDDDEDDSSDSE